MLDRDFFAYCTGLKLLELKAIGELSRVRHLGEGETIYSTGDPGDALFIVNRGVVEVIQPSAQKSAPAAYLSRGDILGEVETLSGLPRKHVARTCEPVSLQCFQLRDFPELIRRVPSFFHFLSSQLAFRLAQARDLALAQSHCQELSGNLSHFDLITVYQTIANSSQTGQLRISNVDSELISAFFFEQGQPSSGQFEHLTGEEAFWQLFVTEHLAGTFAFSTDAVPDKNWIQTERITKNASEMLINALQGRDEFAELKQRLADSTAALQCDKANLVWPASATAELEPVAKQVWEFVGNKPLTLNALYQLCAFCELKIYQVVDELIQSRQLVWTHDAANQKVA
ncbi:MAG TPA: cyclic nucleotide-binding domain-containing protein [Chthoniobacterales bacterium]|nr:cyclic nucleotide-binding domain-containing protein [Chthoniobacterales bacterium]